MAHLEETFLKQVRKYGVDGCFKLQSYWTLQTSNAINGPGLAKLKDLVGALSDLQTGLHFKFSDLKAALKQCTAEFPDIRKQVHEEQRGDYEGTLASALLCICAHVRRLKDPTRFKEACSKCTNHEKKELFEMKRWVGGDDAEPQSPPGPAFVAWKERMAG